MLRRFVVQHHLQAVTAEGTREVGRAAKLPFPRHVLRLVGRRGVTVCERRGTEHAAVRRDSVVVLCLV